MDIARAVSMNSEENEYSVLGLDQLILDGIEEKLLSIVEAEQQANTVMDITSRED